jgi:hypothetical protein
MRTFCGLNSPDQHLIQTGSRQQHFSVGAYERVFKLALTIPGDRAGTSGRDAPVLVATGSLSVPIARCGMS